MVDYSTRRRFLRRSVECMAFAAASAPIAASAAPSEETPKPIIIGALFPTIGALAIAGDESWRGVEMAYDIMRGHGGPTVRLIQAEVSDVKSATTAVSNLRSQGAAAILGTMSSTISFAATESAELAGIPYIELDAPADGITQRKFRTLLRIGPTSTDAATAARDAVVKLLAPAWRLEPGRLRVGVVFDVGASNGAFAAAALDLFNASQIPVVLSIAYAQGRADLDEQVQRMRRASLDLVIHAGEPDGTILLSQAMVLNRWRPRMLVGTGAGYMLTTVAAIIGRDFDRTMVIAPPNFVRPGIKSASTTIADAYRARFAASPRGPASLTAYVGASLAISAIRSGDVLAGLRKQMLPFGALANGFGVLFDSNGQNERSFVALQQWQGGMLVPIDPNQPGAVSPIFDYGPMDGTNPT